MILPLNENNRSIIEDAILRERETEIPALNLETNKELNFKIKDLQGAYRFELFNGIPNDRDTFYTGYVQSFVDIAVDWPISSYGAGQFHQSEPPERQRRDV